MEDQSQPPHVELRATLLALCARHGWTPSFLGASLNSTDDLESLCLKELAACRAAGRSDLAVTLADAAAAAGLENPRLAAHRQRARDQQQPGGSLVRLDRNEVPPLALDAPQRKRNLPFWHWLPGFGGKQQSRQPQLMAANPQQIDQLIAVCRAAGWTPTVLNGADASRAPGRTLLREIRACSEAGEHRLVVRLVRRAAGLGIHHPRLKRARRQAQALLDASLNTQLKAAIRLRHEGQPLASLALLDAAIQRDDHSPWIDDNRARALVDLGRLADAIKIWERQLTHKDQEVVAAAQEMLEIQRQRQLLALDETLRQVADQYDRPLQHLGDPTSLNLNTYTISLLEEAINARENKHPELSLALVDGALAAGLDNPWLEDNRARALVDLNHVPDAVTIWQRLCHHTDENIQLAAKEMIELYGVRARRICVLREADQLLQEGEFDKAISTLTEAVIEDPHCPDIQEKLQSLLIQRDPRPNRNDNQGDNGLESHRRGIIVFEEVLNTLEKRLHSN